MNKRILFGLLTILLASNLVSSCMSDKGNSRYPDEKEKSDILVVPKHDKQLLNGVNFYLENSGSMPPYTNGNSDFTHALVKLLRDIELLPLDTIQIYAANTEIHPLKQGLSEFTRFLTTDGIPSIGETGSSDLNLIFENILERHNNDEISILVTDAIYSVEGTPEQLIQNLETEAYKTRNSFIKALEKKNLGTLCLQLVSNYNGYYYPAIGGRLKINQERPYYIWIFGKSEILGEFSDKADVFNLPGYKDYFISLKSTEKDTPYSIVHDEIGKIGNFKYAKSYPSKEIEDAERSSRPESKGEFGFTVAADFSSIPFPSKHFTDLNNYQLSTDDYELYNVLSINDDNLNEKQRVKIEEIESEIGEINFTHILFFKTDTKYLQTFEISLNNEIPKWISEVGIDNDSDIEGNTHQTFGFDKLSSGIISAYNKTNNNKTVSTLEVTIK